MSHLSPWDLSGVGMGFGLYRPRRPSYTLATQQQRQRSESYRYAVRKEGTDTEEPSDFIEGIIQRKNRKESYVRATRQNETTEVELNERQEIISPKDEEMTAVLPMPASPIILINDKEALNSFSYTSSYNATYTEKPFEKHNGTQNRPKELISKALTEYHIRELKEAIAKKRFIAEPDSPSLNHSPGFNRVRKKGVALSINDIDEELNEDSVFASEIRGTTEHEASTPSSADIQPFPGSGRRFKFKKNLIFLCISFILIFNAFRAIQNLQSSVNADNSLGIIAMSCVHGTMGLTCLWAPVLINSFTAKWTMVIGMFSLVLWIAAHFFPRFYTLIPFGIIAGIGEGILWTAESSYILKLSLDYSRVTREGLEREMFRFHGVFLACFQTTHIFGNLVSSLVLHSDRPFETEHSLINKTFDNDEIIGAHHDLCGVLFPCRQTSFPSEISKDVPSSMWKLVAAYLALGVIAFSLTLLGIDKIGARFDPEKTGYQKIYLILVATSTCLFANNNVMEFDFIVAISAMMLSDKPLIGSYKIDQSEFDMIYAWLYNQIVVEHVQMMLTHKTFRLLIPLLIFSGMQQAFVFSDFNQAYVECTVGVEYIGYCMIVLGLANVISAIFVAVCANVIPREVVFGVGGIIHMGLMIGLLIWIPDSRLTILFIMAASWGVCDAVWQTQCNTLICMTCPDDTDKAFANYRLLQGIGLTIGFVSGTFLCVSFKLYILMVLLVIAIMFYVLAEYKIRKVDMDVFESQIEAN